LVQETPVKTPANGRPDQGTVGANGKPTLAEGVCSLKFNLAHSGAVAVHAPARGCGELGVDLEFVRPIRDAHGVAGAPFDPEVGYGGAVAVAGNAGVVRHLKWRWSEIMSEAL
jgi:hypothetical protein